jgi:hypothetical protein
MGYEALISAYRARIPAINLAGPTSFGPAIRKTIELVKASKPLEFTLCLILCDGQPKTKADTEAAIVEASKLPIAIIAVGIGDGPWDELRRFDDDVRGRKFDNFCFVELMGVQKTAKAEGVSFAAALATDVLWTREIEAGIRERGNEGVKACYEQQLAQLKEIVVLIRGKLTTLARITLGSLTVIDVHARDVTKKLWVGGVATLNDFEWVSQLRYKWEGDADTGDFWAMMVSSTRPYGYEYLGNSLRLVITPLTDKCYMTIMSALQMGLGGAPAGPAGTGKTETTKDLAKALAMYW